MSATSDLLVSYPGRRFFRARREIVRILERLGDLSPVVEKSSVPGIAIVHTSLDNRQVVQRCRELFVTGSAFECAVKWVPVDFWCDTSLDVIRRAIEERVRDRIDEKQTWAMKVEKRRWRQYRTREIIEYLASSIDRKVDLRRPDKFVRIDVLGARTAISLLDPDEVFSMRVSARSTPDEGGTAGLSPSRVSEAEGPAARLRDEAGL